MFAWRSLLLLACASRMSLAQSASTGTPLPRRLPAPAASSPHFVGTVFNLLALPNGTLLVNDTRNHRIMLSDSLLRTTTVVIDSADYGSRPASLIPYLGDSSVFVEAITPVARIIDARGKPVRNMAVANPRDAGWLMPSPSGMAGVDARGRFIHRGVGPRATLPELKPGEFRMRVYPDTSPIIRDDPLTHRGDTLTWSHVGHLDGVEVARADGNTMMYMRTDPVEVVDDWAVTYRGDIAILRGRDYHIDIISADNKVSSLPRISYPWERLSDSMKQVLIDSVRTVREALAASPRPVTTMVGGGGSGGAGASAIGGGGAGGAPPSLGFPPPPPGTRDMKVSELGDYRPAFSSGALKVLPDGSFWIRTRMPSADTTVWTYDVVSAQGVLVDRILLPKNRSIVGFDRHGNVFLTGRDSEGAQWIERVHWQK